MTENKGSEELFPGKIIPCERKYPIKVTSDHCFRIVEIAKDKVSSSILPVVPNFTFKFAGFDSFDYDTSNKGFFFKVQSLLYNPHLSFLWDALHRFPS